MNCTWKCIPLAIAAALALAACGSETTRSDVVYEEDYERAPDPAPRAAPAPAPKRAPATVDTRPAPAPDAPIADDELVGIEACDDYLETYRSCHRVLQMYPADSIEGRFQTLRARLVEQAADPAAHDGLRQQCDSLAADMKTALDGRDCPDAEVVAESDLDDTTLEDAIEDDEPDSP